MRKWIDQSTFDELLLANAEDNIERAIRSASAVLETVQEFVPEAALFYRVTHAVDSLKTISRKLAPVSEETTSCFSSANISIQTLLRPPIRLVVLPICGQLLLRQGFRQTNRSEPYRGLHQKKIDDWVEYLTQGFRNLERIDAENERKIIGYRNRLEALSDVVWVHDKSHGQIIRNGLTYTFDIRQTDYSEKISLDYRCRTLDDFLALSDNKFTPKP